jgi:hypothetical protein
MGTIKQDMSVGLLLVYANITKIDILAVEYNLPPPSAEKENRLWKTNTNS